MLKRELTVSKTADELCQWVTNWLNQKEDPNEWLPNVIWGLCDTIEDRDRIITTLQIECAQLDEELLKRRGFVYVFEGDGYYKIGMSKNPPRRQMQIEPKLPFSLKLVHAIQTGDMRKLETTLHERFREKHLRGEWFALDARDVEELKGMIIE